MKQLILDQIQSDLNKQRDIATKSYESSLKLTQDGDMKSDGKYDTRAIEAGYLSSAQKARIGKLGNEISLIKSMAPHNSTTIVIGSLVHITSSKNSRWYFITHSTGGIKIEIENKVVQVISTASPIWESISDLSTGDEFENEDTGLTQKILEVL